MKNYLSRLDEIRAPEQPELPGFTGKRAIFARRFPLSVIATEDFDGQVELSLSVCNGRTPLRRPTDAHVRAFFRWLGVEPLVEDLRATRHTRHFILPPTSIH